MNTINNLQKLISRFLPMILVLGLMAGCASVTDSNLEEAGQSVTETTQDNGQNADPDNIWDGDGGDDMDPTIDPPPPAEWN